MTFKMLRKRGDEFLSTLITNSTDGIYIIALQGLEYVNPPSKPWSAGRPRRSALRGSTC